jgi:hypothetical protein
MHLVSAGGAGGGLALPDLVAMLDAVHDTHAEHVLPRMAACDEALDAFVVKCTDAKVGGWVGACGRAAQWLPAQRYCAACTSRDARATLPSDAVPHTPRTAPRCPQSALARDVARQLRGIAAQQGRLRELRNRLGLYREALAVQRRELAALLRVRRLPAAYRHCLAECARRCAPCPPACGQAR